MTKDLQPITKEFITYNTKSEKSNTDQRYLISGSQNVLIDDFKKIKSRLGYTLQSLAGTTGLKISASTEWEDSTGDNFPIRAYFASDGVTGTLEFYINGKWETLMSALTSVSLIFYPYYDSTEKIDRLLWCDGSVNLYDWSGATATLSSITATTLTLQGTSTFGQNRFLTTNTRAIRIKDDNGVWRRSVYTGGEATTTLTGLATDLTSFPFSGGNIIIQEVITRANIVSSSYLIDFLKVVDNQVWNGSRSSNSIYVSKNTDITSYSYSTPRAVGEGALLTLDAPGRAIDTLKGDVILFAGSNFIYKSVFNQITVGSSLAETLKVTRVKTTAKQSVLHQNLVANIGNGLVWIGYDNVLHELTDVTLAYNPDLKDVSDSIKPNFDATDFTGGHLKFFQNRVYISAPASTVNFFYEYRLNDKQQREWFWQPPQTFPIQRWAVISSLIHGHSSANNETYKLFDGLRDNGQPIDSIARLAQWNGSILTALKSCDEMFNGGSISLNTVISVNYEFEIDGGDFNSIDKTIDGSVENIIYSSIQDPSLGNFTLGDISLNGDVLASQFLPDFKCIHELNEQEFFAYTVTFETNDLDQQWELHFHSSNSVLSTGKPTAIKV